MSPLVIFLLPFAILFIARILKGSKNMEYMLGNVCVGFRILKSPESNDLLLFINCIPRVPFKHIKEIY